MNTRYNITTAQSRDIEAVVSALAGDMNAADQDHFQKKLERHVREEDFILFLAQSAARWVGLVCIQHHDTPPSDLAHEMLADLEGLACATQLLVHPDFRGHGIGEALFSRAELWAAETDHPGCWFVTHRMGDWYVERFGYRELSPVKVKGANKHLMMRRFAETNGES